ncbi:MAG: hypothetical protein KatS3mg028_0527 [Bacteroidia bacterium]|nr:MAG: hypothetical protein KatS3mg028_0527 [Bacteroidia bacterium]
MNTNSAINGDIHTKKNIPDLDNAKVVIMGVEEDRQAVCQQR